MYCYNIACKVKPDKVTDNAYALLSSDRNTKIYTKRHIILFTYGKSQEPLLKHIILEGFNNSCLYI